MSWLLDTNVVSELRKGTRCDPGVAAWIEGVDDEELFLSVLVIGELRRGIELVRRKDAPAGEALDAWLRRTVEDHADRILAVDGAIAEQWGKLGSPSPISTIDGLLAATALVHGLTLVTRNTKDIARTGVKFENPFSSRARPR